MNQFLELLKSWGPLGAFVVALIDGAGLPNPGGTDGLLLFLGWVKPESAYLSAALAVFGSLTGSAFFYWIARKGGEMYLDKKASGRRAMRLRRWFQQYGLVTVFIPALLPIPILPMKVFMLCAGAFAVNPVAFLVVLGLARIPRYAGMAWLGKSLGEKSVDWVGAHKWDFALAGVGLLVFCILLVKVAEIVHNRKKGRVAA